MGIGASVLLIAVGAILTFALDFQFSGIDLAVVGWILMAVGCLGIVVTVAIWAPRRQRPRPAPRPDPRQYAADDDPYAQPSSGAYSPGRSYPQDPGYQQGGGYAQARGPHRPAPAPYAAHDSRARSYQPQAVPGDDVEYFAGVDSYGREIWVVGRAERREQRADGEWFYLRPGGQAAASGAEPTWVAAEQTRALPTYDPRREDRR